MKKVPTNVETFFMVAHEHSNWNDLLAELARWKTLKLAPIYPENIIRLKQGE
jgi:hypothetical protein